MLRNALGEYLYLGVYPGFFFVSLGVMTYGHGLVPQVDFIWVPSVFAYKVAKTFMLLALVTIVMGALVKKPTAVMSEQALHQKVSGLLKITRHPVQWGFFCSPTPTCLLMVTSPSSFYGTFVLPSLFEMLSMG